MQRLVVGYLIMLSVVLSITSEALAGDAIFTMIDFPGAIFTETNDINARGDVVGRYRSPDGTSHGYLLSRDGFRTIDFPGAVFTSGVGEPSTGSDLSDERGEGKVSEESVGRETVSDWGISQGW